jgi:hypothetical protein
MTTFTDDLLGLFDHAWERFRARMAGLTDDEWAWTPAPDDRIGLRWRLAHVQDLLAEDRNARWLGLEPEPTTPFGRVAANAAEALVNVEDAYAWWRGRLAGRDDETLQRPIGRPAGRYGRASRYSFALHIVDELVHHTAEAALLRDLYAASRRPADGT